MIQTDKYIERLSQATSTKSIIGFRQWIIDEGSLRSIGHGNTIWDANHIIADCGRTTHIAPDRFCECGLYAYYYLPEEWIDEIFFEDDLEPDPVVYDSGYINGIVVGAGRTELHSEGFRSERMQIIAILNNFNSESLKVSESYGVPLLSTYDEVFDYLESLENVEMIPYDKFQRKPLSFSEGMNLIESAR